MKKSTEKNKSRFIPIIICISLLLTACKEDPNAEAGGNDISSAPEVPEVTSGTDIMVNLDTMKLSDFLK